MFFERIAKNQVPRKWWIYKSRVYPEVWTIEFPYWGTGEGYMSFALTFEEAIKKVEEERRKLFERKFPIGETVTVRKPSHRWLF